MTWYRIGTVTVTNGQQIVTGAGTAFVANVVEGEGFLGPDGRIYEIASVDSATQITLAIGYQGATAGGQAYAIVPTQSALADLAAAAAELVASFAAVRDGAGEGLFGDGTVAAPGISFANDQDTGIFRSAANTFGIATGGAERARFDSAGLSAVKGGIVAQALAASNYGYSTTYNLVLLGAVAGNSSISLGYDPSTNLSSNFAGDGSEILVRNGASFITPNAAGDSYYRNVLTFSNGNVGIGVNPSFKLDVNGNCAIGTATAVSGAGGNIRYRDDTGASRWGVGVLGSAGSVNFEFYDFVSGTVRISLSPAGVLFPGADNAQALGSPSNRWSTVYAGTGTINTSDERDKAWRGDLTEAEYQAGVQVLDQLGFYQFNAAVDEKGPDGARFHFGVRAQQVWAAFAQAGLIDPIVAGVDSAAAYAFLCFDSWDAEVQPVLETRTREVQVEGPDGEMATASEEYQYDTGETVVVREAGDRYGVRPDELALFLIAVQARRQAELEARIAALEPAAP